MLFSSSVISETTHLYDLNHFYKIFVYSDAHRGHQRRERTPPRSHAQKLTVAHSNTVLERQTDSQEILDRTQALYPAIIDSDYKLMHTKGKGLLQGKHHVAHLAEHIPMAEKDLCLCSPTIFKFIYQTLWNHLAR